MAREVFADRRAAGEQLASLVARRALKDPLVLALPRGGVPVGFEVARHLAAPLEVFVSRKVGAPGRPEFGIGAVAEGARKPVLGPQAEQFRLTDHDLEVMVAMEADEVQRRVDRYRDGRALPDLADRTVILVDDGLATGVTAEAALVSLWEGGATDVVLAIPTAAPDTAARLSALADVITVMEPPFFAAVGRWYDVFDQTTDDEVLDLLRRSRDWRRDRMPEEVPMESPDTVSEALDLLAERGYVQAFELCAEGVRTEGSGAPQPAQKVSVDYTFRFEGDTDPADEAIVLGVRCGDGVKGVVVSAYGPDIDPEHARLLAALSSRD